MKTIVKIFNELRKNSYKSVEGFNVSSIPEIKNHKLGISKEGYPMFFISCESSNNVSFLDCNLEFITVQYNRDCQLFLNNKKTEQTTYTVISLKAESFELQEYFLDILFLLLMRLPAEPKLIDLKIEINNLIELFSKFSKPSIKTIQGLWAELLVICQSKNVDYLVKSWHSSINDRFDFNDGIDKIEVKSTMKDRRIHNFAYEQLKPNINSRLLIASVFVIQSGVGINLFKLKEIICRNLLDKTLENKINEKLVETLGRDFEKAFDFMFDYQQAIDSLTFYSSENIPSILSKNIPEQISNIRFDCDLTFIKPIQEEYNNSKLYSSLLK